MTGLSATSRSLVQRLVSQHGGRYSPDLTRKCTHLLAYSCEGNKFHYATFWSIPVIRPEWLAECINVGIYVDPRAFLLSPYSPMPPQVAALNLPELPSLPAPLTTSRARAHTLSTLSRSHSTTALDVISDVQPSALLDMPRAPPASINNKRPAPSRTPIATWSSDHLSAMLADCNAAVDSLLTVATVCSLLLHADPRAHPALWHACVTFVAEHLDELETTPGFQALPVEARNCVLRARTSNSEKRRRVEDE